MRYFLILFFIIILKNITAQDTTLVLMMQQFLLHVKENHPVAMVANNQITAADIFINQSKGSFDPVLFGGIDQKLFEGKTYYSTLSTGIKIPTRIGVDLKAMTDWNNGDYLNPQNRTPGDGLSYLGIEAQLGRGMFTDERRTQIKRAEIALGQTYTEKELILNDLLYQAGQAFINWQEQEAHYLLALEGLSFAEIRFQQLIANASLGDRAFIDTVEASAQLYLRKIEVEQRELQLANARLGVENYFWEKGLIPLTLDTNVKPELLVLEIPEIQLEDSLNGHPAIVSYEWKLSDLSMERKLKVEQLKPQFSVNYNLLTPAPDILSGNYSWSNYKWGANLYFPILLRKERNSLAITNIKIENARLEQQLKLRELRTKQLQVRNEWNTSVEQQNYAQIIADRYKELATAEKILFNTGESSLFLVNAREISYLSAQGKVIELLAKANKLRLGELYVSGVLSSLIK
jgi:outer membrane protein TolC